MKGFDLEKLFVLVISAGSGIACAIAGGTYGYAAAGTVGAIVGAAIGVIVGPILALLVLALVLAIPLLLIYFVYHLWARRQR